MRSSEIAPFSHKQPEPPPQQSRQGGRVYATPLVRKSAVDRGIDLRLVLHEGARVTMADLDAGTGVVGNPITSSTRAQNCCEIRGVKLMVVRSEADVTELFAQSNGDGYSFMAAVANATVRALKSVKWPSTDQYALRLVRYGAETTQDVVIETPSDLSVDGIRRVLSGGEALNGTDDRVTFTLVDASATGLLYADMKPRGMDVGVLCVGAVVRRVVPIADPLGGEALAVRSMIEFGFTVDQTLMDLNGASRFLADLALMLG